MQQFMFSFQVKFILERSCSNHCVNVLTSPPFFLSLSHTQVTANVSNRLKHTPVFSCLTVCLCIIFSLRCILHLLPHGVHRGVFCAQQSQEQVINCFIVKFTVYSSLSLHLLFSSEGVNSSSSSRSKWLMYFHANSSNFNLR